MYITQSVDNILVLLFVHFPWLLSLFKRVCMRFSFLVMTLGLLQPVVYQEPGDLVVIIYMY
jgi:hypothetical protein